MIMHPGPYNRGMELDDCVLQFAGWRYAKQVRHGVAIRMAVLDFGHGALNGWRPLIAGGRLVDPPRASTHCATCASAAAS